MKATFEKPEIRSITSLLLPEDQKINEINSEKIRSQLKSHP